MNITKRKPFSPGEILVEEFMEPYGLTQTDLASRIGVARRRINEIINGKRAITPDTALRLGHLFGVTPQFWLNLQMKIDLWKAMHDSRQMREINAIEIIAA